MSDPADGLPVPMFTGWHHSQRPPKPALLTNLKDGEGKAGFEPAQNRRLAAAALPRKTVRARRTVLRGMTKN